MNTLPLIIQGLGLAWGELGGFTSGLEDMSVLMAPALHAGTSGLFLAYLILATGLKLAAYYIGMCRSLALVISIKRRRFSKLDRVFTEADIILAEILSSVAGLAEHALVSMR